MILCSEAENPLSWAASKNITTKYFRTCCERFNMEVIRSSESSSVWIENGDNSVESVMGVIQLFSYETRTGFKSTTIKAYPVHTDFEMCSVEEGSG